MKKLIAILFFAFACGCLAKAQEPVVPEGYELRDTVVFRQVSAVDESYVGKDIFSVLSTGEGGASSEVNQSSAIRSAMESHINQNSKKLIQGYRVRIFFDNKQNARTESEKITKAFSSEYPGIPAYRSYTNPFFKVTVGDFRTKSEAMLFLGEISAEYPAAFVVKESINYPVVDKDHSYVVDTLQIVRPVENTEKISL